MDFTILNLQPDIVVCNRRKLQRHQLDMRYYFLRSAPLICNKESLIPSTCLHMGYYEYWYPTAIFIHNEKYCGSVGLRDVVTFVSLLVVDTFEPRQ